LLEVNNSIFLFRRFTWNLNDTLGIFFPLMDLSRSAAAGLRYPHPFKTAQLSQPANGHTD
jgi:hypothetical protein